MAQLDIEMAVVSGALDKVENLVFLASQTAGNFGAYFTSKELRFLFSCASDTFLRYSGELTEQGLVDALTLRDASEEDLLKYRHLFKQLKRSLPTEADFKLAVDKLIDSFVSRCLIDSMLQAQETLQRDRNGLAAFELLEKNLFILKNQITQKDVRELSTKNLTEEVKLYEDMQSHPEKYRGVKIGIDKLDEVTGGFRKGELVVAMGATKVGKSIFLLNCQYNTMLAGYSSAYFSIEMSDEQCRRRLVSRITGLPYLRIKNVKLSPEELGRMRSELETFEQRTDGHSLIVDIPENCTPKMIEAKTRALMKKQRVDLVLVDYLLLMQPSGGNGKLSREEKINQVALELKQMARSLNIPVITATQVTAKAAEKRSQTSDDPYDWVDASQAKSVATHCDWLLSLKREPDTNILNLGIAVGRDGALDAVIPLVTDYSRMALFNYVDATAERTDAIPVAEIKTEGPF